MSMSVCLAQCSCCHIVSAIRPLKLEKNKLPQSPCWIIHARLHFLTASEGIIFVTYQSANYGKAK